jgi:hypothetical protein
LVDDEGKLVEKKGPSIYEGGAVLAIEPEWLAGGRRGRCDEA